MESSKESLLPEDHESDVSSSRLMQAVQYNGYGAGPSGLKHVKIPIPTVELYGILIKIEAATINPFDWKVQEGMLWPLFPGKFPHIPGNELTGEVVDVGTKVQNFKPGDKVVSRVSPYDGGAFSEYIVCSHTMTVKRPQEISAEQVAGLPIAGLTAHWGLTECAGLKLETSSPCTNILITAASGGVGHYAVQLAKLANCHVTATCGPSNVEMVKSLGADEVLDYTTEAGAALKSPSGKKYDVVLSCAPGIPSSSFDPHLSENGIVVDVTPHVNTMLSIALQKLSFSRKRLVPLLLSPKKENLEYLVDLVKEGKLKTVVDSKHSLSNVQEAWAKSIAGHAAGKIIVVP
ncbi:hypothetical protein L6164_000369 [Bauhinia variegata]|uniref:Uncharacterized protein n=1 Tax=Bauhinia variegata TaxID=167791 RepID=A0ACB9Q5J2_BAUVA|nr:hypothetical protein L6164_000369 [Bauhinia variegata]